MTWVPTGAIGFGILSEPSPIAGGVEEISRIGDYLQQAVDASFDYRNAIHSAERTLANGQGDALNRLRDKLAQRLLPGLELLDASAVAAKAGVDGYAQEVDRIHTDARALIRDVEDDLSTIRTQAGEISEIADLIGADAPVSWDAAPPGVMPEPQAGAGAAGLDAGEQEIRREQLQQLYAMQWLSTAVLWKRACDDIESAKAKWASLVADRKEAEGRLVGALRATDLGRLIDAGTSGSYSRRAMIAFGLSGEIRGAAFVDERSTDPAVDAFLEDEDLSGTQLAEAWSALGLGREEIVALPMESLARLAKHPGLPAWVQDIAARELLHSSLVAPNEAYGAFGFGASGPGVEEFRRRMLRLHEAWRTAQQEADRMGGKPTVQLLALGSHDGALTAAISHGDLDTASHVGVNVSGMLSNVAEIGRDATGARSLFNEAYQEDPTQTYAAVTWIGYRSPSFADVNLMGRANAGGPELAAFIDGIFDSRNANGAPAENFTVFAHSYGSTTAAVALEQTRHRVTSFVTYGSAGVAQTTIEDMRVDGVFATHASGDQTAPFGTLLEHPFDPRMLPGVTSFSAEGGDGYTRVTAHDMFTEDDSASPLNWGGKVGYLTTGTRSAEDMGKIWANGRL